MTVAGWDGVTLSVEIALSAATAVYGVWDSGIWSESEWGPDEVWTDVTTYVRAVSTSRGFSRGTAGWQGGSATVVLDNQDGRFSPANLDGPYVTGDVTQIRPLRPIRIRATYDGTMYPVWRGYVTEWRESWMGGANADALVTLPCEDEWSRLAVIDGMEVSPVGSGESSGARVHRILDFAGHSGDRNVDVGENTLQATTLASDVLAELELTTDSEGGALFIGAAGEVVFSGRLALIEDDRSILSQATFGDDLADELPYAEAEVRYDADLVLNEASFTRVGGSAQNVSDATSRSLYGISRDTRTDLICETDGQALALAQWVIQQYKDPELRFTRITITPRRDPTSLYPQALGREVRDLITVLRRPPGSFTIERPCHISGISHEITADNWVTTFELWSASTYVAYANSLWNTGIWDESLWFF